MNDNILSIKVDMINNIPVLRFKGDFVMTTLENLRATLNELIKKGYGDYVFDFKNVKLIDSIALGFIYTTCDNLRKFDKDIKLCSLNENLLKIVKVIGMIPYFHIYETAHQAVSGMKRKNPYRRDNVEDNLMVYQCDKEVKDKIERKPRQYLFDEDFNTVEIFLSGGISEKLKVQGKEVPEIICIEHQGGLVSNRTLVGLKIKILLPENNVEFIPASVNREKGYLYIEVPPIVEIIPRRIHKRVELNLTVRYSVLNLGKSSQIRAAVSENLSYSGISMMVRNDTINENDILGIEIQDERPTQPARLLSKVVRVNKIGEGLLQVHCAFFIYNEEVKRKLAWLMKDIEMLNKL
ncbi:MAG: STAS domain-containing protein [Candidatus Hydrogenedentota bacterium]